MTMTLVEKIELTSSQASITFSNIPSDGTDLLVLLSARGTTTNSSYRTWGVLVSINGSTANFTTRALDGSGSGVGSFTETRFFGRMPDNGTTASTFGSISGYFPNYAGSTNKSFSIDSVTENNETTAYQTILASLWSQTAAISSLTLSAESGNFASGSSATLYKITKGSDGTTTVS